MAAETEEGEGMSSIVERINEIANQVSAEGMTLRAADIRSAAVEIARLEIIVDRQHAALRNARQLREADRGALGSETLASIKEDAVAVLDQLRRNHD